MDSTRRMSFFIDELHSSDDENSSREGTEMSPPEMGSNIGASTSNADSPAKKRAHSNVWDHFTRSVERGPDGKVIRATSKCKICNNLLNAMTKNDTSHLTRHLKGHAQQNQNKDIRQMMVSQSSTTDSLSNWTYDHKVAHQSIVK